MFHIGLFSRFLLEFAFLARKRLYRQVSLSLEIKRRSMSQLVQYIVIRGDLFRALNWPVGAVVAQACHACTAVMWTFREDPNVIDYTNDMDNMRKVVLEVRRGFVCLMQFCVVSWRDLMASEYTANSYFRPSCRI